jgi:hypothetical protein
MKSGLRREVLGQVENTVGGVTENAETEEPIHTAADITVKNFIVKSVSRTILL